MEEKEVIMLAAQAGARAALESIKSEQTKKNKAITDRRHQNIKKLLKSYREIKIHSRDAIASLKDLGHEDYDFFKSLMENREEISVQAIISSKAISHIILTQINTALDTIRIISHNAEDLRRYRILEAMYLSDERLTPLEIAERESIDLRTVYRDVDSISCKLSMLLFGITVVAQEE